MCKDFYQGPKAVKGKHWWRGEEEQARRKGLGLHVDAEDENGFEKAKKACDQDPECHGFMKDCDYGDYSICKGKIPDSLKQFDSNPCDKPNRPSDIPMIIYQKG